jgi:hemerythrin
VGGGIIFYFRSNLKLNMHKQEHDKLLKETIETISFQSREKKITTA